MKVFATLVFTLVALAFLASQSPVNAKDCGVPPANSPFIPNGLTATNDDIGVAIRAVQDYGLKVQTYINCLQLNKDAFFLNMNEDQRERWSEDFNALADKLTEVETSLNDQIRIYNNRS